MQRLKEVLNDYLQYSKHHNKVEIVESIDEDNHQESIIVKWSDAKSNWYPFEQIEFPKRDLNKRVEHYTNKLHDARNKV